MLSIIDSVLCAVCISDGKCICKSILLGFLALQMCNALMATIGAGLVLTENILFFRYVIYYVLFLQAGCLLYYYYFVLF